jgi:hypothetical protein
MSTWKYWWENENIDNVEVQEMKFLRSVRQSIGSDKLKSESVYIWKELRKL